MKGRKVEILTGNISEKRRKEEERRGEERRGEERRGEKGKGGERTRGGWGGTQGGEGGFVKRKMGIL